jgi:hypothetical protein
MAYDLHIERPAASSDSEPGPITLTEWRAAVSVIDGVRIATGLIHTITNPKTGEQISFPISEGDAEVYFPDQKAWHLVFRWRDGSAIFTARIRPGGGSPVWVAAAALAAHLLAVIRGDEGEIYDLSSGQIIQ